MFWQCSASRIDCYSPPTAVNWAFGVWGQFAGDGYWFEPNNHIEPHSLYYSQLSERVGQGAMKQAHLLPFEYRSTSSPSIELAQEITVQAKIPAIQLKEWIEQANIRQPIPISSEGAVKIYEIKFEEEQEIINFRRVELKNGWLITGNSSITGSKIGIQWWKGTTRPYEVSGAGPHITRYVPGRTGKGLTDDLTEVSNWMLKNNILAIEHNYGLWYDRRRDDHEMVSRIDGDVWPPFYELPFARSGEGIAWDGLSKYDLTKPNHWYWMRLKQFADLADQKGLLLIHQSYFQHNILEAGAHYADFPWRTANNINETGFPEPPNYAGNKRIFMAEQFYDVSHPVRAQLHKQYIRQCLENVSNNTNVIQLTGKEYTGPLHFVEFWIDVIREWENETEKNVLIGLSCTKDVQDAILADPIRLQTIDIIDIRYWQYRDDGSIYAPKGGQNLSPRQHARLVHPGKVSFESVYRAVSEYRIKYPDKAVIYSNQLTKNQQWAVFIAGGSMVDLPADIDPDLLVRAAKMNPVEMAEDQEKTWGLSDSEKEYIIYVPASKTTKIDYRNPDWNILKSSHSSS
ncbi:hypothetical protein ES708_22120 [subsurface metagenome]